MTCPTCGFENATSAKFCSECGARLVPDSRGTAREERKVVSVLFADLVGFTSRAERLDPEDVRSVLAPYHARLRGEIERFGGTVEKFIGDAVVGVFGDKGDAHHVAAEKALAAAAGEDLRLPASAYSEVLVGPATQGRVGPVREEMRALALGVEPITEEVAERAAVLRARHRGLRLPDALVLGCAEVLGADAVVTADRGWRRYSKRVSVIG